MRPVIIAAVLIFLVASLPVRAGEPASGAEQVTDDVPGYEDAVKAAIEGDARELVAILKRLAELGDVPSQFRLGWCYRRGHGITKDPGEAFKWIRRAALGGHEEAMETLAGLYGRGEGTTKSVTDAVRWYERAARAGSPWAHFVLGHIYRVGKVVEVDYARAFDHYAEAARQEGMSRALLKS